MTRALLVLALLLSGCADDPPACNCGPREVCVEQRCLPANMCPQIACPTGQVCSDGACVREPQCAADIDCPGGRCVEGGCYAVECEDGEEEQVACGQCGTTTRVCRDRVWIRPNACDGQGDCEAGAAEDGPCGMGTRTCSDTCAWNPWDGLGDACEANTTAQEACGACGVRTRDCDGSCAWGPWSECDEEAGCVPGAIEDQPCGSDVGLCSAGTQQRTCGENCVFGDWSACEGAVQGTDELCGDGIDQDCDGADLSIPDDYEPNNTCATAFYVGDDPNPANSVDLYPNFHDSGDTNDYFFFTFHDDLRQYISVTLEIPPGHKTQLFLYRNRADCVADRPVTSSFRSNDGDDFELITWFGEPDVDESGNWYIRIRRVEGTSCESGGRFMRVQ